MLSIIILLILLKIPNILMKSSSISFNLILLNFVSLTSIHPEAHKLFI
jgi:hypothetical protein